jgi:outer membrane protein
MKMIRSTLIFILALPVLVLSAQEQSYTLSLDEAVDYALQHNKTLLNARGQVASSVEGIREARATGLPQVSGSIDFMTYFNYEMDFSFGGSDEGVEPPNIFEPPFDDGDRAVLGMMGSIFESEPIIMNNQMSGAVTFSQLIFSGQYWSGLEIAKIARALANQNVTLTEQDVKEGVINSYYLILVTERNLEIIQDNIKNLDEILQHTVNMYQTGVAEATDVDQLKVTMNQLKNTQKAVDRAVQMGYNMLKFQLGVDPSTSITLNESIDKLLNEINPSATLDPAFDVTTNINYTLMESQVQLGEKQVGMQNWANAPSIAGFYSYTKKIITTGFDLTPNHLAGFSVSVPIFSSGARHARINQAKVALDIARRNQEMVKEQLETQKNQLLYNYQNALENYETQKENVEVAGRVYKNIQNKYQQGMMSSLDLTQVNTNLLNAESNYLSAIMTLLQAQTSLDKLFNKI